MFKSLALTFFGDIADLGPILDMLRVVGLQFHHGLVSTLLERLVLVEPLFGSLVESLKVANRKWFVAEILKGVLQVSDQHTKLGAPITKVIQLQNIVTHKGKNAGAALTDNC